MAVRLWSTIFYFTLLMCTLFFINFLVSLESLFVVAYLLSSISVNFSLLVSNICGTILLHEGTVKRSRSLICLPIGRYLIMVLLFQLSLDYMRSIQASLLGSRSILNHSVLSNDVTIGNIFSKWNGHLILLNYLIYARWVSPLPQFSHDTTVRSLSS